MQTQISTRGTEVTDDLRQRVDSLSADIADRADGLELLKVVLEERESVRAVGVVLSWGEQQETVVRHAEAADWERAFLDLGRRIERALAEDTAQT